MNDLSALGAVVAVVSFTALAATADASRTRTTALAGPVRFAVGSSVQPSCLASASTLNSDTFTGVAIISASAVTVTCTDSTTYNVGFTAAGTNSDIITATVTY